MNKTKVTQLTANDVFSDSPRNYGSMEYQYASTIPDYDTEEGSRFTTVEESMDYDVTANPFSDQILRTDYPEYDFFNAPLRMVPEVDYTPEIKQFSQPPAIYDRDDSISSNFYSVDPVISSSDTVNLDTIDPRLISNDWKTGISPNNESYSFEGTTDPPLSLSKEEVEKISEMADDLLQFLDSAPEIKEPFTQKDLDDLLASIDLDLIPPETGTSCQMEVDPAQPSLLEMDFPRICSTSNDEAKCTSRSLQHTSPSKVIKPCHTVRCRPKGSSVGKPSNIEIDYSKLVITTEADLDYSVNINNINRNKESDAFKKLYQSRYIRSFTEKEAESFNFARIIYSRPFFNQEVQGDFRIRYSKNENFKKNHYEAEYFRSELDFMGITINSTRSGLCPYCPEVNFYKLKTSAYGNHLAYVHGILTSGEIIPDVVYSGWYSIAKGELNPTIRKTTAHIKEKQAAFCPDCYNIVELSCTNKSTVMGQYFRHFRNCHVHSKTTNPLLQSD
ncbi:uncharacterized protein RJT20DRAFT_142502 [Scheffersomyces xylosifermentans]|uniref:uncharacterized protein n=1 Tax=Scheffersomyces xylosifermentans TaxID=1304137 RepID=UPI00315DC570